MQKLNWPTLRNLALAAAKKRNLDATYMERLQIEFKEIEKQGANSYWCDQFNERKKYNTNDNGLVFPWVLGLTPVDPLLAEHKFERSPDQPDIDVDCLPEARDKIKAYAAQKYGSEYVCSVGTWMAYKFKSALQDAARGLGADVKAVVQLTKELPDDVDELKDGGFGECTACKTKHKDTKCPKCGSEDVDGTTIGKLLAEYDTLKAYNETNPIVVDRAVRMVGKIKNMGKHAGGIIITNQRLLGNVPMGISKGADGEEQWTSMWTEGRNTQLSKLGYVKWDLLGLKTLQYIHQTCKLIEKTRGIKFNTIPWKDNDPEKNSVGWYTDAEGNRQNVPMDDKAVFKMINELKVETVFQFETDVQKGVLASGVRDYYDLQVFNAMGHPGPIAFIPEYVKRRDDTAKTWMKDEHPEIAQELIETHGIIVYQEQLADLWRKFAGFTAPEAESARKAVAKKWVDKLKPIKAQWETGAAKRIGERWATEMWTRMETFGRYAFNRSHSAAYILVAYWCAWLKVHFAPEWWACVMSGCHSDRLPKYMNTARIEGVEFGDMTVDNITRNFSVNPEDLRIMPGLVGIKGVGDSAAVKLEGRRAYNDIDHFVTTNGKSKTVMEPLIKLGAFKKLHPNTKATWMWYMYKYCSGKEITEFKKQVKQQLLAHWTPERIAERRQKEMDNFKSFHPKRKIPNKIMNWSPPVDDRREMVMALYPEDFTLRERLKFEKQYLGYYWHSPLDLYVTNHARTIQAIKKSKGKRGKIEVVVEKLTLAKTKTGNRMGRLHVTDGLSSCAIIVWSDQLDVLSPYIKEDLGLSIDVQYDHERDSFTLAKDNPVPIPLRLKVDEEQHK